jgi:arylformamidase
VTDEGLKAAGLPLDAYLGKAVVVDAAGSAELTPNTVADVKLRKAHRILFRTRASVDAGEFPSAFAAITPELAELLVKKGIRLVGTDAPSVDPADSKTLDAHRILVDGGVAILENLMLSEVEAGKYTLIALPLKLEDADSSPVRAVLIEGKL